MFGPPCVIGEVETPHLVFLLPPQEMHASDQGWAGKTGGGVAGTEVEDGDAKVGSGAGIEAARGVRRFEGENGVPMTKLGFLSFGLFVFACASPDGSDRGPKTHEESTAARPSADVS